MSTLEQCQAEFVAALRDPDRQPPLSLTPNRPRRFNVYRNNVYAGLIGVLEARYPAVQRLVGTEFFGAMARIFIDAAPPRSPVLLKYGADFPEFLAGFAPVSDVPYLVDVARLERQMHAARHAADIAGVRASALAAVAGLQTDFCIDLAPSVSVVASNFPIFSLWRANVIDEGGNQPCSYSGAQTVLVTRPALTPEAVLISESFGVFIACLRDGKPVSAAAAAAFAISPDFPLDRTLALLITQKAIASVTPLRARTQEIEQ